MADLTQNNMIDQTIAGFLKYESDYYTSANLNAISKPIYTHELDFDVAFLDNEQIFKNNFDTIIKSENSDTTKLKQWFGLCWNRSSVMPSNMRGQRKMTFMFGDEYYLMRVCEVSLFICIFANVFEIGAMLEQRNLIDRGHDVPVSIELQQQTLDNGKVITVNNKFLPKANIRLSYSWDNEFQKMSLHQYGSMVSLKYGVKMTFPVISAPTVEKYVSKPVVIKVVVN